MLDIDVRTLFHELHHHLPLNMPATRTSQRLKLLVYAALSYYSTAVQPQSICEHTQIRKLLGHAA
jgi:hypothetical protein